ncbi:hypothetical protein GCM10027515_16850 [Schumannella luteola]|uniref:CBM6 domain-containing protein n=1 Tax=Schumannella luteola TaxID=472059 RepID=A0A852YT87_9MICO|nr:hypothetical protein [Schumannella luteola]NYH00516.1 hypothetical protein [Schumannella luteola]TPX06228.1 hypothetical protein FJ656_02215 [Schumannella luteola]
MTSSRGRLAVVLLAGATALVLAACTGGPAPTPAKTGASESSIDDTSGLDDHGTGLTVHGGPAYDFLGAGDSGVTVRAGDDWSLPASARPAANSGFFSEQASPQWGVGVRSIDVSWRQVASKADDAIDGSAKGTAQGMDFASLDAQLKAARASDGGYWMRLFASGEDWAPKRVAAECKVTTYGPDYDGERHLPIWNECVWSHLLATYRALFRDQGLAVDPKLRFVYVPGAFTWAEFDYDIISDAAKKGDLTWAQYSSWYSHAWTDLVEVFGPDAHKLVFTGEDHPWGPFGKKDDLLAKQAVDDGLGIRTGITELSNFHLSDAPAYGSSVQEDGHLVVDESLPIHDGTRIVATENECYTACGYETDDPYYAVRQSNLKALQLRMNWIYVVPADSYLPRFAKHWDWVRLSMGQTASTSSDAWADLRTAEDTAIDRRIRNLERWLVQVDEPGSVAHRSDADVHRDVLEKDNGTAWEGLTTDVAGGDTGFVFDVDARFAQAAGSDAAVLKVTYLDEGSGDVTVTTSAGEAAARIPRTDSGAWMTATVTLPAGALGGDHRLRLGVASTADDLTVRFVRVVRL